MTYPIQTKPLPACRLAPGKPFQTTGLDYAGPLAVRTQGDISKIWIALFVCATTPAIHMETVLSLSLEDFLLAFRRFVARRGEPHQIISDNASTFQAAAKLLQIRWDFIPPYSPWMGGFYERLVRAVKTPLRKVLGQSLVWEKELNTLIVEVERLVNSRPLTHVGGEDELEFEQPVTPSMLMGWVWQEKPLSDSKPAADQEKESLPARARYLKKLQEHLTHRWEKEYVLQLRLFEDIIRKSIKEGDVVLIADAKKKRMEWKLGLVTKTHKGRDGRIRVAEVRRGRSTFLRSVHCLLPLEVS